MASLMVVTTRRLFLYLVVVVAVLVCVSVYHSSLWYPAVGSVRQGEPLAITKQPASNIDARTLSPPSEVTVNQVPPVQVLPKQPPSTKDSHTSGKPRASPTLPSSYYPTTQDRLVIPSFKATHANCAKLFAGDEKEINNTKIYQNKRPKSALPAYWFAKITKNCERYRRKREYATHPLTEEEAEVPIAFSILFYKDVEQFERLLRVIYRPQNYYCVHVDAKAHGDVKEAATAITGCFPNVFMASTAVKVEWGTHSLLKSQLVCMADLWKYSGWKYFINLTGQEFPLQTMLDIVKILKIYNGANDIWGKVNKDYRRRVKYVYKGLHNTHVRKSAVPVNVTLHKGGLPVAACRGFVDYVLHNRTALTLAGWLKDTQVPDETLFSTLQFNPHLGVPGSFIGANVSNEEPLQIVTQTRHVVWKPNPCSGKFVRRVCIPGVGELPGLYNRTELFMNKIHLDYHPLVLDCMEELILNRTRDQLRGFTNFNASIYENMYIVKYHQ